MVRRFLSASMSTLEIFIEEVRQDLNPAIPSTTYVEKLQSGMYFTTRAITLATVEDLVQECGLRLAEAQVIWAAARNFQGDQRS